jgi:glycosyltransferase involved in cell wall biosynthesis
MSPRISIVIPTLQEEKALARTLSQFSSAIRKEFFLEIIVSDGGSTDRTVEIANACADRTLEHSNFLPRQTISRGRNLGAAVARGEILIFLNADVILEDPEKFLTIMSRVIQQHYVAAATCNVNIYPEEERFSDWLYHNFFNGYFWLLNMLGMGMGRGECQVIRRSLFEQIRGYNEQLTAGEDYELFLRLKREGRIAFVRSLTVFESPRRFRKLGYLWVSLMWLGNALSVLIFRRSLTKEWKPIR